MSRLARLLWLYLGTTIVSDDIAVAEARFPHAPVEVHKGWPEMIHRYFAGTLGLIILGLSVVAVRQRRGSELSGESSGDSSGESSVLPLKALSRAVGFGDMPSSVWHVDGYFEIVAASRIRASFRGLCHAFFALFIGAQVAV